MHGAIRIQTRQAIPKRQWRLGTGRAQAVIRLTSKSAEKVSRVAPDSVIPSGQNRLSGTINFKHL